MRSLLIAACMTAAPCIYGQTSIGWIAPEGKIINNRTLTWADFQGKEDKEFSDKLAEQSLQAKAYVCPNIYFKADSGEVQDNGRVKFTFHVKCAFQSKAFVRESTKEEHSNYVLIHEQDHYDIALTFANKLQAELSSRDYSKDNYNEEINKIYDGLLEKYHRTQETYDKEVNPQGSQDKPKQYLWDMRIKKCLENNTDEFFGAPEAAVQSVKLRGQTVKRIPGEAALQFAVRARPLYSELPQEMATKVMETNEWSPEPAVLAFYTQKYYIEEDGAKPKDNYRTFGYMFIPSGKDTYKRVFIDTFSFEGNPALINTAFFANADSDQVKELVITTAFTQKDKQASGTLYTNKVYDNVARLVPTKLKKLDDVNTKIEAGFDGIRDGKPMKAKYKNEREITEALKKMGY